MRKKFDNLHLNGFSDNEGRLCKKRYVHEISEAGRIFVATIDNEQGVGVSGRGQNKYNLQFIRRLLQSHLSVQHQIQL